MSEKRLTISQLRAKFCQTTPDFIRFEMALATTHEARLQLVEKPIDWISQELSKNRHLKLKHNEDQLTIDFIVALKAIGFQATHDTQYGGHCDIVIEGKDDFLWIAEAKIDTSNSWIMQGFNQLSTRYSTGLPGQDTGEILIYCRKPKAVDVVASWLDYLGERQADIEISEPDSSTLSRRSQHTHHVSGLKFRIRHTPVALCFAPNDK